jgi:hypothetical protein
MRLSVALAAVAATCSFVSAAPARATARLIINGCSTGTAHNESASCQFLGQAGDYRVEYSLSGTEGPWVTTTVIECPGSTPQYASSNPGTIRGVPGGLCTFSVNVAGFGPFTVSGSADLV